MFELVLFLLIAIGTAAVTMVWAWHDHVVTHPWAARPNSAVERIVDRWERTTVRITRSLPRQQLTNR